MNIKIVLLSLVFVPVWQSAQTAPDEPTPPNWSQMPPHEIPHCDIPARAERDPEHVAPCKCPGMVNRVQTVLAEACWVNAGVIIPDDPDVRKMVMAHPSEEILACLGKVPDHCQIVAGSYPRTPPLDRLKNYGFDKTVYRCQTYCKPERCGCADSACREHGPGRYGQGGVADDGVPEYE